MHDPHAVALMRQNDDKMAANDEMVVADTNNHAIRCARSPATGRPALQTGRAPRASTAQWAWRGTRTGALEDRDNNAGRRVTMEGEVGTVAATGRLAKLAMPRFNGPCAVVVDKEGTIALADRAKLLKIVGRQVTSLAGGSEDGTGDCVGAGALPRALRAGAGRARAPARVGVQVGHTAAGGGRLVGAAGVNGPGGRGGGCSAR